MQRQRGELIPIGEVVSGLDGPVKETREASPQARHHFTRADQVNQLVGASEADPDRGFMGRTMALCSLPRTNPGNSKEYKRVNGPYTLYMTAGGGNKLPFGNLPRLLLAWLCTEAVETPFGSSAASGSFRSSMYRSAAPCSPPYWLINSWCSWSSPRSASLIALISCLIVNPSITFPGSAAAQSCSIRSALKTISSSAPTAMTSTRREFKNHWRGRIRTMWTLSKCVLIL